MASKKKTGFKNNIKWLHRWLGLVSGLVVFIVSVTGACYVFEEEGRELFQHEYYHVPAVDAQQPRLSMDVLVDSFRQYYPTATITSIRFKEQADAAFIFFTPDELISVNPVTGAMMGVRGKRSDFFSLVKELHTELCLGAVGKEIVRWNVLIFFLLCISGLILWFPRQWRFWKQAVRINFKTKNRKRLNWDLHSVLGFYAVLVLLVISLTGLFWSFDTVKNLVATVTSSESIRGEKKVIPRVGEGTSFSLQQAYQYAATTYPGAEETFVTPPSKRNAQARVIMRYPYNVVRKQNTFYFDANTGKLVDEELYNQYTAYDKVARANFNIHTGRIRALGIGSKIIYFLVSLIAASLPITGFFVWWGRRKKKPLRKPLRVAQQELEMA